MRQQAHVDELRPNVQKKVTYFHKSLISSSQAAQILFQFTPAKTFSKFMNGVEPAIHTGGFTVKIKVFSIDHVSYWNMAISYTSTSRPPMIVG